MDIKDVHAIMEKICAKMPFYNEAQFQLEFALAVKEKHANFGIMPEVYYERREERRFEEESAEHEQEASNESGFKTRKNYTDIVIYDKRNGDYIAVELKYALTDGGSKGEKRNAYTNVNGDTITVAKKGAIDNCRYDFLWDVHRLEELADGQWKYESACLNNFVAGYAILISNARKMWEQCRNEKGTKQKLNNDNNFRIGDNSDIGSTSPIMLNWEGGSHATRSGFELKRHYSFKWGHDNKTYFKDVDEKRNSPEFRYLVVKVEKTSDKEN